MATDVVGQWEGLFDLENVAAHASLLPTGKVLYWGRRANPFDLNGASLNEHFTKSFIWDPANGKSKATATQPRLFGTGAEQVNLFCAGHAFQPDGKLLIVGGHLFDGQGVNSACTYDPFADKWDAKPIMNNGRWYPSALTLPDGNILAISGSFSFTNPQGNRSNTTNITPQIWRDNAKWTNAPNPTNNVLSLYPRLHLDPTGRIFMAGPQAQSQFLDVNAANGAGAWTKDGPERKAKGREYAPAVSYDAGKVMYIGGGNDPGTGTPTKMTEFIDLNAAKPQWTSAASSDLLFARRQHNATVLPDGTVLVTGGTRGPGFNNLDAGQPVHEAELWNPTTKRWTLMAKENADRCYHSTALLLPDGRVISAGGGEYSPANNGKPNPVKDSLKNAQVYKPAYLFKGGRPTITNAPTEITYGQKFDVTVAAGDTIAKVSWVRLGSVTHACNMNQSLIFLSSQQQATKVTVTAPANVNLTPPGHYMLFVLNARSVPSVARIVKIKKATPAAAPKPAAFLAQSVMASEVMPVPLPNLNQKIITEQARPPVVVGLTPVCPYGLGPCWGGAFDALQRISDIDVVRPVPSQTNSVAFVYLREDILPDIDVWRKEFEDTANGAYEMRGIEITLSGTVNKKKFGNDEKLALESSSTRPELVLAKFQANSKIEWDMKTKAPQPTSDAEAGAYKKLSEALAKKPGDATVEVTGRLQKHDAKKFSLEVREFKLE